MKIKNKKIVWPFRNGGAFFVFNMLIVNNLFMEKFTNVIIVINILLCLYNNKF